MNSPVKLILLTCLPNTIYIKNTWQGLINNYFRLTEIRGGTDRSVCENDYLRLTVLRHVAYYSTLCEVNYLYLVITVTTIVSFSHLLGGDTDRSVCENAYPLPFVLVTIFVNVVCRTKRLHLKKAVNILLLLTHINRCLTVICMVYILRNSAFEYTGLFLYFKPEHECKS